MGMAVSDKVDSPGIAPSELYIFASCKLSVLYTTVSFVMKADSYLLSAKMDIWRLKYIVFKYSKLV